MTELVKSLLATQPHPCIQSFTVGQLKVVLYPVDDRGVLPGGAETWAAVDALRYALSHEGMATIEQYRYILGAFDSEGGGGGPRSGIPDFGIEVRAAGPSSRRAPIDEKALRALLLMENPTFVAFLEARRAAHGEHTRMYGMPPES